MAGEHLHLYAREDGAKLVVVFVYRGADRRILSARKATKAEAKTYYETIYGSN